MKKYNVLAGTMHCRNCEVEVEGKFYHVLGEYFYVGEGETQATYYVIGEENIDVALLCGCSLAKGIVADAAHIDEWFWVEVNTHVSEMIEKYEYLAREANNEELGSEPKYVGLEGLDLQCLDYFE